MADAADILVPVDAPGGLIYSSSARALITDQRNRARVHILQGAGRPTEGAISAQHEELLRLVD